MHLENHPNLCHCAIAWRLDASVKVNAYLAGSATITLTMSEKVTRNASVPDLKSRKSFAGKISHMRRKAYRLDLTKLTPFLRQSHQIWCLRGKLKLWQQQLLYSILLQIHPGILLLKPTQQVPDSVAPLLFQLQVRSFQYQQNLPVQLRVLSVLQ